MKDDTPDLFGSMIALGIVLLIAGVLTLCTNQGRNTIKHWDSTFHGYKRKVTLYDANGKPLKSWITTSKVEDKGGSYFFIDENDKSQRISGTVVIEEL